MTIRIGQLPTSLAGSAGESIRINAGGTAWEFFTPGGGITIGDAVSGGGANRVLTEDASQNLAAPSTLTFSSDILTVNHARIFTPYAAGNFFAGSGAGNTGIGNQYNTGVGQNAGASLGAAYYNSFFGASAGSSVTTGIGNSIFGYGAGAALATGSNNAFFGTSAGAAFTGSNGSMFGYQAGKVATGAGNSFFGSNAGALITTAAENTMMGSQAGLSATSDGNSIIGSNAGYSLTSGANNTYLGYRAGYSNVTGAGNVFIGKDAGYSETGSNKLMIGNIYNDYLIYGDFSAHTIEFKVSKYRITTANTPASASATGTQGEHCWDANYLYVCTATDTWKRAALSTW